MKIFNKSLLINYYQTAKMEFQPYPIGTPGVAWTPE